MIKLTFDSSKCNNVTNISCCSISVIGARLRNSCATLVLSFLTNSKFTDKSHSAPKLEQTPLIRIYLKINLMLTYMNTFYFITYSF